MSARFFNAVRAELGEEAVDLTDGTLAAYGANRLPGGDRCPSGVLFPRTAREVQVIVQLANRHEVTLWPTSTGQNLGLGEFSPVRAGQAVVHLGRRMNRIVEVDETLGYAVIEPGVTFRQLRAELAARGDKFMISSTSGPPDGGILGNALDRGAGYTPYFDHFGMLCGLEVVLGNGEVISTGDAALPGAKSGHVNKSGFGPLLDGLFSQSNYGIVTRAAIWLMPRPPVIRAFAFTFPDERDLAEIIDLVRPLKMANVVPTLIKVTSSEYAFATRERYPFDRTGGATPLPEELRRELASKHGIGAWTVTGACYGPSAEAVEPTIERIRAHLEASGKATYLPHEQVAANPVLAIHLDTFSGEPTEAELGLLDWRPGGGATWFLPATPMIGAVAAEQQRVSLDILSRFGFERCVEFVCGPRAARALHVVMFNRADPAERRRMDDCYAALVAAYDGLGYPIGRTPSDWQERAMSRLPGLAAVTSAVKGALDPNRVLAPGKYGI
jgi:4-cresol dehydrogenase (hydroxylating)